MLIVIYNERISNAIRDFNMLSELLPNQYSEYAKVTFNKRKSIIEIGDDILIDFRVGDVCKMAGMRPDYFMVGDGCKNWWEAENFLMQGASKVNGRKLESLDEVVKVIEKAIKGVKT